MDYSVHYTNTVQNLKNKCENFTGNGKQQPDSECSQLLWEIETVIQLVSGFTLGSSVLSRHTSPGKRRLNRTKHPLFKVSYS